MPTPTDATPAAPPASTAPPAPPSVPPSPPSAPAAPASSDAVIDAAFPDLDEMAAPPAAPAPPAEVTPRGPDGKFQKAGEKPPETKPPAPIGTKPAEESTVPKFQTPKELRKWAESQAKAVKDKEAEIARLNIRLQSLEEGPPPATVKEDAAVKERVATLQKQLDDRENELRTLRYERSEEYKSKYEKPYVAAARSAYELVGQLTVKQVDPETNETKERQATQKDFDAVAVLPEGQAWRKAKELFGDDAQIVYEQYRELKRIEKGARTAIDEHRQKAAEMETTQTATQAAQTEGLQRMWRAVNEDMMKKYPQWFGPDEADAEGNKLLEKGYQMADSFFSNRNGMTPQQKVILDARMRNQAAAFPRLVHQLKTKDATIAQLREELKAFEASVPGKGKRPGGEAAAGEEGTKDWESALDALPE